MTSPYSMLKPVVRGVSVTLPVPASMSLLAPRFRASMVSAILPLIALVMTSTLFVSVITADDTENAVTAVAPTLMLPLKLTVPDPFVVRERFLAPEMVPLKAIEPLLAVVPTATSAVESVTLPVKVMPLPALRVSPSSVTVPENSVGVSPEPIVVSPRRIAFGVIDKPLAVARVEENSTLVADTTVMAAPVLPPTGVVDPTAPGKITLPEPAVRDRLKAPSTAPPRVIVPAPAPVLMETAVVRMTGLVPKATSSFVVTIDPARFFWLGAVAVAPPSKVNESPASSPMVRTPVFKNATVLVISPPPPKTRA